MKVCYDFRSIMIMVHLAVREVQCYRRLHSWALVLCHSPHISPSVLHLRVKLHTKIIRVTVCQTIYNFSGLVDWWLWLLLQVCCSRSKQKSDRRPEATNLQLVSVLIYIIFQIILAIWTTFILQILFEK